MSKVKELNDLALQLEHDKDEPENALKCLKQALDLLSKESCGDNLIQSWKKDIFYHDVVIAYNLGACYMHMNMLEEAADHLERAVSILKQKVDKLVDIENRASMNRATVESKPKMMMVKGMVGTP